MFKIISKRDHQWMKDQIDTLRGRVWDLHQEREQVRRELEAKYLRAVEELEALKAKGTPRVRGAGGRWAKVDA